MERSVFLGLDIGSTTAKLALVAADGKLLEAQYLRHGAAVRQTLSTTSQASSGARAVQVAAFPLSPWAGDRVWVAYTGTGPSASSQTAGRGSAGRLRATRRSWCCPGLGTSCCGR